MTGSMQNSSFTKVTIRSSKSRRFHGRILAGVFSVIGALSFLMGDNYVPDNEFVAGVCAIVAVAVYFISSSSSSRGVAMTISKEGVWYRDWKLPVIPWRHVDRAYSTGIRLRPLLRIDLADAEILFSELNNTGAQNLRNHELVKSDHLLIPNGMLEAPISEISSAINAAHEWVTQQGYS